MRQLSIVVALLFCVPAAGVAKNRPKVLIAVTNAAVDPPARWWHGDAVEAYVPPVEAQIAKVLRKKGFRVIARTSIKAELKPDQEILSFARKAGAFFVVTGEITAQATGESPQPGIHEVVAQVSLALFDTHTRAERSSSAAEFRFGRADANEAAAYAILGASKTAAKQLVKSAERLF